MEHRYGARIDLGVAVDVAAENRPLGRFKTRNIGRGGMFLETGPIALRPNDSVRLQLPLNGKRRRMSAVVAHRSKEGIGVMLMSEDPEYARFFLDALDGHPAGRSPAADGAVARVVPTGQGPAVANGSATRCTLRWTRDSATLVLRLGERLDISACSIVEQAIESIRALSVRRVVVDLAATRAIFDSGIALLLLLRERAGQIENRVYLARCTPRVFGRLVRAGIASEFRIGVRNADRKSFDHPIARFSSAYDA